VPSGRRCQAKRVRRLTLRGRPAIRSRSTSSNIRGNVRGRSDALHGLLVEPAVEQGCRFLDLPRGLVRRAALQIEVRGQPEQGRQRDEGRRVLFGIVGDVDDNAIRFARCLPTSPTYGLREQQGRLRWPRHNDRGDPRDVDPFPEVNCS
jgi:hypothetical protein